MSERKTEQFVRKHFEPFSEIMIEEQGSDNVKIQKLLSTASIECNRLNVFNRFATVQ